MNPLQSLLGGGVADIFDKARALINQFVPSPEQKAAANLALVNVEKDFREKEIAANQQFAESQSKVIIAEAQSDSWLTKSWRPITMLVMLGMVVWDIVVVGTVHSFYPQITPLPIPPDAWELLKLGIGGYIGARTVEKVTDKLPDVVAALKK